MNQLVKKPQFAFVLVMVIIAVSALLTIPAFPYLSQLTSSSTGPVATKWDFSSFSVQWNLNLSVGSNIQGSRSVADVMQASFDTWTGAPNTALAISRGADTSVSSESSSPSNINLICFICIDTDFSKDASTLAVTITTSQDAGQPDGHGGTTRFNGQIIKSDILFNPASQYNTGGATGSDLQVVATHEIGHFLGLDHSGVVRSVMFPFASSLTTLSWDDVAGISTVYPKIPANYNPGTITGRVTLSGAGVFGAHVYAQPVTDAQPIPGTVRKSPISTLTLPDGTYKIQGVPADSYTIVAEPLDGPVDNGAVSSYGTVFSRGAVQTNFTTRWR